MQSIYVTTSIPYVNANPHIGFALELVQADVIARYQRLLGVATRFQTGADENALKNVLAAREQGVPTQQFVDGNSRLFQALGAALGLSNDDFLRTTEPRHRHAVQHFWGRLRPDDVYVKAYEGQYCVGCEDFLLERDLVDGCCPDHAVPPVTVREENYFFRLSAYQQQIEELLVSDQVRIIPEKRKHEVLAFVRNGLQDISISRSAARAGGWGITIPGDPSQVIYVWIDALINYISGLGFGARDDWANWWQNGVEKVHVIGKNVWKFHAVYWPALLLSAGLPLPDVILVHGFLTANGRKISKSLGNTVDPFTCIDAFGVDGVRYYLLRALSPFDDGDFSLERKKQIYTADLANGLGNLLSRLTTLCAKGSYGSFVGDAIPAPPEGYHEALAGYVFDKALESLWSVVAKVNQQIVEVEPWKLLKAADKQPLYDHLNTWLHEVQRVGYWLAPFLPVTAERVLTALRQQPISPSGALFPRIEEGK